jgi:hypothetical protein
VFEAFSIRKGERRWPNSNSIEKCEVASKPERFGLLLTQLVWQQMPYRNRIGRMVTNDLF